MLNQQGDVIRIIDQSGTAVAEYSYDAWDNLLIDEEDLSDIGHVNPIRYRGYYYDTETGFYYLQSRYYDPSIGRFINADAASYIGASTTFSSYNLFTYCLNDPVNNTDDGGTFTLSNWAKVGIGVAIIAAAAAITVATGGAAAGTLVAAVNCAAHGALVGAVTQGAAGAVTGAISGAVTHRLTTGSWDGAAQAAANGAATGFLEGTISGAINGAINSPYCFVAGTLVLTVAGTVAIETIQAGDMVWAWDEKTGAVAPKEVVETYVNETYELIHVLVDGEEIVTTPSHPFYSPVKGWTNAVHLRAGDVLVLVNGEYVIVEKVQHEILETPVTVYNFEVEDYHTYFVSEDGVLVHNNCNKKAGAKRGPKPKGKGAHNELIVELADDINAQKTGKVIAGGRLPEKLIKTPLGTKSGRRPDILVELADGSWFGINVGKLTPDGIPVKREIEALCDLVEAGIPMVFVPYG